MSVTELAELSKSSQSYISQVKTGKCKPSKKLLEILAEYAKPKRPEIDYFALFLQSREAIGVSESTLSFYKQRLTPFIEEIQYLKATRQTIERFLNLIPPNKYGLSTRHASFRALKTFYRWLNSEYGFNYPMANMPAPILGKPILPSLSQDEVLYLIDKANCMRDKAIIALFTESGLRRSELTKIKLRDIDWSTRTIQVIGKGRKWALSPFGELSEKYLKEWLVEYEPVGNIWGLNESGISTMLKRLGYETGFSCNPHTFRRTFACLLRKAGIDVMTIKDLGRWESLEMVQRYTRSINFHDSLKFYKAPLS